MTVGRLETRSSPVHDDDALERAAAPRAERRHRLGELSGWVARSPGTPVVAFAVVALLPQLLALSGSDYRLAVNVAIFGVLALGLTVVWGFCGQPSFGHAGLFGLGAYTVAILTVKADIGLSLAFALAPLVGAAGGLIMGLPTLRVQASYVALVTFAMAEALRSIEARAEFTGGSAGLSGVPPLSLGGTQLITPEDLFYPALLLLVLSYLAVRALRGSATGRAMQAVGGDEFAARSLGVNPGPQKLLAFMIGGALAGLAGAFYASFAGFVSSVSFDVVTSVQVVSMVILGGLTIAGAIVGAAVITVITFQVQSHPDIRLYVTGAVMLGVVLFRGGALGRARSSLALAWRRRMGDR